jgi:hypothetical protein
LRVINWFWDWDGWLTSGTEDVFGENYDLKEKLGKENVVLEHELEKDQGPGLRSE